MNGKILAWATAAIALALSGCNCGNPAPAGSDGGPGGTDGGGQDAGPQCGGDPCGACLPGQVQNDVCQADGTWACQCLNVGNDGGVTDGGFDPYAYCQALAAQECDFMIRCHSDTASGMDVTQGRTTNDQVDPSQRAACEAKLGSDPGCIVLAEGWAKGRSSPNVAAHNACINAAYPAGTCVRDLGAVLTNCIGTKLVTPGTAIGGMCTNDTECINSFCSAQGAVCGTCTAYLTPATGPNCVRDGQCDPTVAYCPGTDANPAGKPCTLYTPVGNTCNGPLSNADPDHEECGPNAVCTGTTFGQKTCQPPRAEGQGCVAGNYECQWGIHYPFPADTCAIATDGGTTDGGNTFCVPTFANLNATNCGTGDLFVFPICPETQFCSSNSCIDRRGPTGICQNNGQCAAGLACNAPAFGNGTCQPFGSLDAGCNSSTPPCKNFLACDATGTCQPDFALVGDGCDAGVQCADGFCSSTDGGTGTCQAPLGDGQACSNWFDCTSYVCATDGGSVPSCQPGCWQ